MEQIAEPGGQIERGYEAAARVGQEEEFEDAESEKRVETPL